VVDRKANRKKDGNLEEENIGTSCFFADLLPPPFAMESKAKALVSAALN